MSNSTSLMMSRIRLTINGTNPMLDTSSINRVEGAGRPLPLSHHRTCGSASGGSANVRAFTTLSPRAFVGDRCRERLGPLTSPSGFTTFASSAVPLSGEDGLPCAFRELFTPSKFAVQPFPVATNDRPGTMASADSCSLTLISQ